MANPEHVKMLVKSTKAEWNAWRENEDVAPDLSGLHFARAFLGKDARPFGGSVDLRGYNLRGADLTCADMSLTMVYYPDFEGADTRCTWFGTDAPGQVRNPGEAATICAGLCRMAFEPDPEWLDRLLKGRMRWNRWRAENPQDIPELSGVRIAEEFQRSGVSPLGQSVDLSGYNLRNARMRAADFRITKLDDADLSGADLRCSNFEGTDARRTNFGGTDLRHCQLTVCRFMKADLTHAKTGLINATAVDFNKAKFDGQDFNDSSMAGCDLTDAKIRDAKFRNTNLDSTTLVRTEFVNSELRESRLFSIRKFEIRESFPVGAHTSAESVQELLDRIDLVSEDPVLNGVADVRSLYFRGLSDVRYELRPTVMRDAGFRANEDAMMNDLTMRRPDEIREGGLFFQKLVMARHYELPTRLLDITRDPLVALHYAVSGNRDNVDGVVHAFIVPDEMIFPYNSDTVSLMANFTRLELDEKDALLTRIRLVRPVPRRPEISLGMEHKRSRMARTRLNHFIAQEKPYWDDRINLRDFFRVLLVEPQRSFDRLIAHSGAFMLSAYHERFERWEIDKRMEGAAPYGHLRIVIPEGSKSRIRSQLRRMGTTDDALKADLQSTAEAIADEYRSGGDPMEF